MRLLNGWRWIAVAWAIMGIDRTIAMPPIAQAALALVGIACAVIGMVRGLRDYSRCHAHKP